MHDRPLLRPTPPRTRHRGLGATAGALACLALAGLVFALDRTGSAFGAPQCALAALGAAFAFLADASPTRRGAGALALLACLAVVAASAAALLGLVATDPATAARGVVGISVVNGSAAFALGLHLLGRGVRDLAPR